MFRAPIFRALACIAALMAFAEPAVAATLRVTVLTAEGRPVPNAVATVRTGRPVSGPIRFSWPMRIAQQDMRFEPFVLIAPSGASVAFPNLDDIRHQVYSFSPAGPFELRLYGHDETRSVTFRNAGVIAIGCNIHDGMSAFIYVVDTPYAAKTNAQGIATILDVPAGAATVRLWHPYLRAPDNQIDRPATLTASDSEQRFEVRLRAPPDRGHGY